MTRKDRRALRFHHPGIRNTANSLHPLSKRAISFLDSTRVYYTLLSIDAGLVMPGELLIKTQRVYRLETRALYPESPLSRSGSRE